MLAACSSSPDAKPDASRRYRAPPSAADGGGYVPRFEPGPCPSSVPARPDVRCGVLEVPERHRRPNARQVRLAVATLAARAPAPAPDPLLILVGGPGDSGLEALEGFLTSSARDARDLVFLDQRGTGSSAPSLACPEIDALLLPELEARADAAAPGRARLDATRACRARLVAAGVDIGAYTSAESAADVADLRIALGIDEWNVQGTSYGTRLALTLVRDHPAGIRSLVLDSAVPLQVDERAELRPNAQRAFDELFAGCAADAGCASAYGNLEERTASLVRRLDAGPVSAPSPRHGGGPPVTVVFDGNRILTSLFGGLYDTNLIPALPSLLAAADRGELATVATAIVSETVSRLSTLSRGMNLSVVCAEEEPFGSGDAGDPGALFDHAPPDLDVFVPEQCDVWDVAVADRVETRPVTSPIPTLIVAGQYDPITPPSWGLLVAKTLPASFFVEFRGQGHGQFVSDCPRSVRAAFLDDPSRAPESSCVASMPAPSWVVPPG